MLGVVTAMFLGCHTIVDPPPPTDGWRVEFLVANATAPSVSNDNTRFLFLRDGDGLFLWDNGIETRVTPEGVTARPDYSWSLSGENAFTYSVPGSPENETAGIFVKDESGVTTKVWDRGSAPVYVASSNYILCAGPPESELGSGIWRILLPSLERERLNEVGTAPQICADESVFLYLAPQTSSNGATLVARRLSDLVQQFSVAHVSVYKTDFHSSSFIIEIIANDEGLAIPPAIYRTAVSDPPPLALIAQPATNIALLDYGDILLNRLNGDELGPLYLIDDEGELFMSDTLYDACANNKEIIFATGPSGISRLTAN